MNERSRNGNNKWIIDVLNDMVDFADANKMHNTKSSLTSVIAIAAEELLIGAVDDKNTHVEPPWG